MILKTIKKVWSWIKRKIKEILIITGVIGIASAATFLPNGDIPEHQLLKADKSKILASIEVDDIVCDEVGLNCVNRGKMVKYLYVSEKQVPKKKGEDISKRLPNAEFYRKGRKKGKEVWTAKIYSGNNYYKEGDKWFQIEIATTTPKFFKKQMESSLLEIGTAKATTESFYAGSGVDGTLGYYARTTDWNTIHDAATAQSSQSEFTNTQTKGPIAGCSDGGYFIRRNFIPFDTSSLPDDANITSATLNLYIISKYNDDNDGDDWINVVGETTQADVEDLVLADYDQCGSVDNPDEGATRIDIGDITTSDWNTWTLNATGTSWISKTGYTKLGLREGHDCIDRAIDWTSGERYNGAYFRTSEYAGTDYDPYLEITYTVPSVEEEEYEGIIDVPAIW